ncbi:MULTISPECIES: PepSY domain-containing protein [Methylotenera]|uniref:PepSY domain-containing protein n=1 Tax=Methylotenera TaxID=359407 RepID=UPI00037345D8|nr:MULTISPECIES: PepSY domain-containing protein [Methylotenera]
MIKFATRYLSLWHRWLGIFACILFMLWFATGLVLHFVHFPELSAEEKFAGLKPIAMQNVKLSLYEAIRSLPYFERITRAKLVMSGNRPVYVVQHDKNVNGIYADTGEVLQTISTNAALVIANQYAEQHGIDVQKKAYASLDDVDQWTVSNGLDAYRPLHRVLINDDEKTELYISDITGEVVRDTTQFERGWNYVGSVVHWIYPTFLRKHWDIWNWLVWTLSLIALIAAITGIILGVMRLRWNHVKSISPFRGMHYLHHLGGVLVATFLLTYILSGWLSMDHGLLFSRNNITATQRIVLTGGKINWQKFNSVDTSFVAGAKQLEWVQLAGNPYVIATFNQDSQKVLSQLGVSDDFAFSAFTSQSTQLLEGANCTIPILVDKNDAYRSATAKPSAQLLRVVCDDAKKTWFHIDGSNAQIIEKIDHSRRWYRWLYGGLHTLDFPVLDTHPQFKTALVMIFCVLGFMFSLTGVVLSLRRLRLTTKYLL